MNTKELRILYVDDDVENQQDLKDVISGKQINKQTVTIDCESDFESSVDRSREYHIVILDLYKGDATNGGEDEGSKIFEKVKDNFFIPVIFYSGNINEVKKFKSQVVGVASKGDGVDALIAEIDRLTKHNLPFLKNNVHTYIEGEFKKYFWEIIQKENDKFTPDADDFSLGYMLLRNIADSLSKENIKNIIGDDSIKDDKVHPMEFYIYPMDSTKEFENAEIVKERETGNIFVILTPSCDFVSGNGRKRKVENVLLATTMRLEETDEYKGYMKSKKDSDENNQNQELHKKLENKICSLKQFLNSSKSDRFFFLPGTPFIENRVIDFQKKTEVSYDSLRNSYERITKLDSPFAQSMTAQFIRYYNRIGFPDIDTDYVINGLENNI